MPVNDGSQKGFRHGVKSATSDQTTTLAEFVASQLAASGLRALDLIELGAIYVGNERCLNPARALRAGDEVRLHTSPRRFACPDDLAARIIAETGETLLVEKPAGLPAEPTVDNVKENLLTFLQDLRGQNLFLTHRLSADTEGLILIAKTTEAAARIAQAFAEGKIQRQYAAYVESQVPPGEHALFAILSSEERRGKTNLIAEGRQTWQIDGAPLGICYRLVIQFTTARPKEIREALASLGAPILGDRLQGSPRRLVDPATGKPALAFRALSLSTS